MRTAQSIALYLAASLLAGCYSTSATVVSSGGGQSISQAQAASYNGPQRRIAVSDFDVRSGQDSREIGSGMSDMLTNALFNTGRFIVLERDQLDEVMKEQDLANSGRFKKETAAAKGQLEGAELLIRGSIIQFEPNCKGGSAILVSGKQACMTINLRIVDGAAEALPFDDASFDTVVCTFTLCSVADQAAAIGEARRVFKPGGHLLFCEHGLAPDKGVAKWQRRIEPMWKRLAGGCHLTRPVTAALVAGGFHIEAGERLYLPRMPRIGAWVELGTARRET